MSRGSVGTLGKGSVFWAFPDNPHWSFTVSRMLGLIDFGAANFAEMLQALNRITDGDEEGWFQSWNQLALQVEDLAQSYLDHANRFSWTDAKHRAANYHRMAQFFLSGSDSRKVESLRSAESLFCETLAYLPVRAERIAVPYLGMELPGYYFGPPGTESVTGAAILYVNGADSLPSEVYFTVGKTLALAGYHFYVYESPGVGLSLYERHLPTRYDSEAFISPALDWLGQRSEVVGPCILMGESFAGYLVPRAAAYDARIRVIVVSSPIYRYEAYRRYWGSGDAFREHLLRLFGCGTPEELRVLAAGYTLSGVLDQVRCPALLIQGAEDPLIVTPVQDALRVLSELGSADKRLIVYESGNGLGGFTHCQKDNLHLFHGAVISWLRDHGY